MTVLAHTDCAVEGGAPGEGSSSAAAACEGRVAPGGNHCCSTACACRCMRQCDGQAPQLFASFKEEDVDVAQLAARLRAAGLMQHWGAATGLPPPS